MSLSGRVVGTLYRTELRLAVRDRRTVLLAVVLPALVMPVIMFAQVAAQRLRERKLAGMSYAYAVVGPEAVAARELLHAALALEPPRQDGSAGRMQRFEERRVAEARAALDADEIAVYVEADRSTAPEVRPDGERLPPGVTKLTLVMRADRDTSRQATEALGQRLGDLLRGERGRLLSERTFQLEPGQVAALTDESIATAGQVTGLAVGRPLTLLLTVFLFMGGAVLATDALAGEKERGTLETLLTTAAGRGEVIVAKGLAVLTASVTITLVQAASFLLVVGLGIAPLGSHLASAVTPAKALLLFVLYLPLAAMISAALLATSGRARSFKEAQLYLTPVMLLAMLFTAAPFLPGLRLRSAIVLVPLSNLAVAAKEILTGRYDWPWIVAAWLVTAAAALLLARQTVGVLETERLLSPAQTDRAELGGGPELFPRRVLPAFAVMWAFMLVVGSGFVPSQLRPQIALLFTVFTGGSLLLVRIYRLDPRQAFALRPVRPPVWLAVLIGAPTSIVVVSAFFRLLSVFLPVPREMGEAFEQVLMPTDIPRWQLALLLTLAPGIGEELAFRGVLLHGLRRRFHPAALALVVGLVFGLFHMAFFRIPATALIGVGLAAVTLLTGSIFPAMLWHALYNGSGLVASQAGFPLDRLPWPAVAAGGLGLVTAYWILWRCRTPYPDLRPWRRPKP